MKKTVAALLFDQVNSLDLTGPIEVFASARRVDGTALYAARYITLDRRMVTSESGVRFVADAVAKSAARADLLIIPGGAGIREPERVAKAACWLRPQYWCRFTAWQ
jgi:transcriptional regulator GlxA family with amidase domain